VVARRRATADVGRVRIDAEGTDLGSATPQLLVVFWIMVGAAVGALAAGLFARRQRRLARREHMVQLRRREGAIERLKTTLQEHTARLKRRDEQLRELAALRAERVQMAAELDQLRRSVSEMQGEAEAARSQAREVELRLTLDLDRERHEHASRRASGAAELASAQESALNLRAELAAARESASRLTAQLEADLASTRAMLERTASDLHIERAAAQETRAELTRRVSALEHERFRLESEAAAARRATDDREQALRHTVSTLREQYTLACAERDAAAKEADAQRTRLEETTRALEGARAEFARRLDEEHAESVLVLSRLWEYVHTYPRLRERPVVPPPPVPPHAPPPARRAPLADEAPVEAPGAERDAFAWPAPEEFHFGPATVTEPSAKPAPGAPPPSAEAAPPAPVEREVTPPTAPLADGGEREEVEAERPAAEPTARYDIERALGEAEPRPITQPGLPPVGTRVRRPISAMRREHDVLVICDDGSVWSKKPTGWTPETPIPGSEVERAARAAREARERAERPARE
jgi:hypothetical protein